MPAPNTLRKTPEHRQLAIAAACYLARGLRLVEIAEKLHHKEPYVCRLLAAAEAWGCLSRAPVVLRHNIADEDWDAVQQRYFQDWTITPALKPLVPRAGHCFEAFRVPGDYEQFLRGAACHIGHAVRHSQLLGVMWGRTVYKLVRSLQAMGDTLDRDSLRRIECIPLCGDPTFLMNQQRLEFSASWLASALEEALTGRAPETFPCLAGVPAYLSRDMRAPAAEAGLPPRSPHERIPGFQAIFGRSKRLIDRVDTIITGAGIVVSGVETKEHSTGDLIEERVQQEGDITKERLEKLIWGDIGGWLLEKPGLKSDERKLVDDLNRGWTGATLQHLGRVAAAAQPGGKAGVILVARAPAKARLVVEAITRGLANIVLVDESLGDAIKELVPRA